MEEFSDCSLTVPTQMQVTKLTATELQELEKSKCVMRCFVLHSCLPLPCYPSLTPQVTKLTAAQLQELEESTHVIPCLSQPSLPHPYLALAPQVTKLTAAQLKELEESARATRELRRQASIRRRATSASARLNSMNRRNRWA